MEDEQSASSERATAHNVRVDVIMKILETFQRSDFVDIIFIPQSTNNPDVIRIVLSQASADDKAMRFSFKNINDFI